MKKNDVMSALLKRALGYMTEEVVEEYAGENGGGELIKRKITKKPVLPDIGALKTYIELTEGTDEFARMSDAELKKERDRLLEKMRRGEKTDGDQTLQEEI